MSVARVAQAWQWSWSGRGREGQSIYGRARARERDGSAASLVWQALSCKTTRVEAHPTPSDYRFGFSRGLSAMRLKGAGLSLVCFGIANSRNKSCRVFNGSPYRFQNRRRSNATTSDHPRTTVITADTTVSSVTRLDAIFTSRCRVGNPAREINPAQCHTHIGNISTNCTPSRSIMMGFFEALATPSIASLRKPR